MRPTDEAILAFIGDTGKTAKEIYRHFVNDRICQKDVYNALGSLVRYKFLERYAITIDQHNDHGRMMFVYRKC